MSLRAQITGHFVRPAGVPASGGLATGSSPSADLGAPARAPAAPSGASSRANASVAVLTTPHDALALGGALGLAVARRRRAPVVVLCVWSATPGGWPAWRAPAFPAASRLAARLAARGHDARAAGRLAIVRVATHDDAHARQVLAAGGSAPTVLALGGPRTPVLDELLAEQDLVVIGTRGGPGAALTSLALAGLSDPARACACEIPGAHPGRTLAAAGMALLPSVRRALEPAAGELS
ncbi:MAG TPA: hypothetical protein VMY78_13160 [Solirubrobacteraceae bacterium]|nr:hypothetical protein [Solirubrobacteraceae bacterium]